MNRDNKIIGILMTIFAAVLLVTYLFFGMEDDIELPTPIPELKDTPKNLGMSGEYE